jgi:hypothetical protein
MKRERNCNQQSRPQESNLLMKTVVGRVCVSGQNGDANREKETAEPNHMLKFNNSITYANSETNPMCSGVAGSRRKISRAERRGSGSEGAAVTNDIAKIETPKRAQARGF